MITLQQILELVGTLEDTPGLNTARERFRNYLASNATEMGTVRDYVGVCLTKDSS